VPQGAVSRCVQFRLRWACVLLDDADLPAPSGITGIPRHAADYPVEMEQSIVSMEDYADHISEQPSILSLQRANVAGLGLVNVNLADCRFSGAHNLDQLRLEADIAFGLSPARAGWERRNVLAEECSWRANHHSRANRWD
jgi:hypothetical protein